MRVRNFGGFLTWRLQKADHQTAKFSSPPNFPGIQYVFANLGIIHPAIFHFGVHLPATQYSKAAASGLTDTGVFAIVTALA